MRSDVSMSPQEPMAPILAESIPVDGLTPGLSVEVADPTVKTAFDAMGYAHDLQQWQKVVDVGDAWLAARGGMNPTACTWYAQALQGVSRYEDAVPWAQLAAKRMPRDEPIAQIAAWSTYAQALSRVGHFERAKTALATCVGIDPKGHAETIEKQGHMLAVLAMTAKKPITVHGKQIPVHRLWPMAWAMMERRLEEPEKALPPGFRPWDGVTKEPVAVLHEQGLGDAILTARWLPSLVEATGHAVTYYGPDLLHPWMATCPGVVVGDLEAAIERVKSDATTDLGAAVRCMSLAHACPMATIADLPAPFAPAVLRSGRQYRDASGPVRIGVCWKGASIGWHDFERSYTPDVFASVFAPLGGVEWINLAHDADVPEGAPFEKVSFRDVLHTGEVIARLDLVVTVDTGVAHIAGSLGVPTVVIPPTVPDWRWVWPRGTETPFYANVTVVRRRTADDRSVLSVVRTMVEQYAQALRQQRAA